MLRTASCQTCDAPLDPDVRFCTACGANLDVAQAASAGAMPRPVTASPTRSTQEAPAKVPVWPIDATRPGATRLEVAFALGVLGLVFPLLGFLGVFLAWRAGKAEHPQAARVLTIVVNLTFVGVLLMALVLSLS